MFCYVLLKSHLYSRRRVVFAAVEIIVAVFAIKLVFIFSIAKMIKTDLIYGIKYWYSPLLTNLDIFLVGFLVNPLLQLKSKPLKFPFQKQLAVLLIALLYFYTAYHLHSQELHGMPVGGICTSTTLFILQRLTAWVTAFFIYAFESSDDSYKASIKNRQLSFSAILENPWRSLEIFGNLSYGIYIWHIPLIAKAIPQIAISTLPIEAFYSRVVGAVMLSTLMLFTLLATVTYYLVELPAVQWKRYRPASSQGQVID